MAIKINVNFNKTEDKGQVSQPVLKPVNPLWNKNVTPSPVIPRLNVPTSAPVVPRLQIPQAATNRIQTMKESALEPQKPTLRIPFNFKDTTQGSRGTLTAEAQRIALEQTPAPIAGTLGGIGSAFGIKNTPEQEQYLRDTKKGYGAYSVAGNIVGQIGGYGAVNAALKGTKLGATLVSTLGKKLGDKAGGYVASQGAQLLADAIVQAPMETLDAIQNDKSIAEDAKQILINRAIDLGLNMAIQGGSDAFKKMMANKKVMQSVIDAGVPEAEIVRAIESNNQQAIKEIQNKVSIKGKEYEVSKGTAQGSVPITETKPSLMLASGQKVVKPEFTLKKPTENLYTPTQPKDVFSIQDRSITNVGKTNLKPYSQQNPEVVPFYKEAAKDLKADLLQTVKGQQSGGLVRVPDGRGGFNDRYVDTSTSREASESVTELLETLPSGPTYKQIEESLDRIATGQSKNALDKQIEVIIDKRLTKGFRAIDGTQIKPDGAYINAKVLGEFEATAPPIKLESPLQKRTLTKVPTVTKRLELPKLQPKEQLYRKSASMDAEKPKSLEGEYTLDKKVVPPLKPVSETTKVETPKTDDELVESFSKKVSPTPIKKKGKTIKEQAFNARKQFEDDLLEFQRLEKSVKGKVDSAEKSIYKTARVYKGAPEKANEFIRTELAPVIDKVVAKGGTQDDLSKYALAIHARDVNNAGLKSGMSDEEINAVIKKYGTPELEQARKELVAVSNKALDELMASGRISKESVDAMREKWPNYMPLSRSFDDEKVDFVTGLGKTFSNVSNPIQKLKGSERDVIDPIESMVKNIYKITDAAERNKVGVQLAELAYKADDSIIRKLDADEAIGRKNVVTVYVDGKKQQYEVEPEVFKAFNNLDKESSNTLINMLSKPASLLRAGATLTPEFALRNPFRDIQNTFVVSKSGFNPLLDFPAGLASTLKKDELYSQWLKEGGGYGNIMSMDRQAHKEALENALKQPIQKKFVNIITPKGFMAMLRMVSDVTESATKVGEFKAALRSGATPQEAAFRSRDLMDFARSGYSVRPANKVVAFLNANVQGKSKLVRAIADNPKGVMARMATSMVLPTLAVSAFASQFGSEEQKRTIKDAPDWLRNSFWLVPIPGTDMIARFPKPFDISVVANTTERFIDYISKNDKEAFDGFVKSTLKDQSIPLQLTGLLPLIEAQTNYSFFREGPIIPMGDQYREKKDQYDTKTSHLARALAGVAGKFSEDSNFASPKVMDYVIKSSTAGLGQYAIDATDFIANGLSKDKGPVKPSLRLEQAPIAKAFLVSPFTSGKSVDYVYSMKDKLSKEKSSAKFNDTEFSAQKQSLLDYANDQTKQLTDISKAIKEVEKSNMTSGQKRDEIVRLTKERNKIAQDSADYIKKWDAK